MKFKDWYERQDEGMGFVQRLDSKSPPKKQSMKVDSPKDINKAVDMFVKGAQKKINDYHKKQFPNMKPDVLKIQKGKRYIKIVQIGVSASHKSVWAFIDAKEGNTFGDILKPASWNAPAKHSRGNVFDGSWGVNAVGPYGPAYMR